MPMVVKSFIYGTYDVSILVILWFFTVDGRPIPGYKMDARWDSRTGHANSGVAYHPASTPASIMRLLVAVADFRDCRYASVPEVFFEGNRRSYLKQHNSFT